MQSKKKGVASFIQAESLNAGVTHCCSYNFDLKPTILLRIPNINIILQQFKYIQVFFNSWPKWKNLLSPILERHCYEVTGRQVIKGLCKTRWPWCDILLEQFSHMDEAFEIDGRYTNRKNSSLKKQDISRNNYKEEQLM